MNPGIRHRIAIIEDDPIVRDHFIDIVTREPAFDLAGVAPTIARGRDLLMLSPDLFLVDIGLPDGSGLDFIPEIKRATQAKILVVTSFGDRDPVVTAIRGGADGYLLKDSPSGVISEGISVTLDGGAPISAAAAVYLLDRLRGLPLVEAAEEEDSGLTPREVELLQLFARGDSYKEAARTLGISPLTVGNHVKSIYRKLAVHSRGEAVFEAAQMGLLPPLGGAPPRS